MKFAIRTPPRKREPDLTSLINVVFLILIFFIVAGTLRPFSARDLELVKTVPDKAGMPAPARLIAQADGTLIYAGAAISANDLALRLEASTSQAKPSPPFVIVADARLDALELTKVVRVVKAGGFSEVHILTEQRRAP